MDVTIIGTGNMARGVATRALTGGHSVTLIGHTPGAAEALAGELDGDVRAGEAIEGDVVVLAVWYQAIDDLLSRYGSQLDGKVVVDITNPVDPQTYQPLSVAAGSVAQEIAGKVPGARVVKAFNTTFASTLAGDRQLDVFIAGDDEDAKAVVARLVADGGMRAVDVGPLALAHHVEAAGYVHMAAQASVGANYDSALTVQT